jgi:ribonucleotide reductase, class II
MTQKSSTSVQPAYGMDLYQQYIHISRYSRWRDDLGRRETWEETVQRYVDFFDKRTDGAFSKTLQGEVKTAILNMDVMPSMRALMTAGEALERENLAGFNCSYLAVNSKRSFAEALYILMCGTGVGFSCERQEITKLPAVPANLNPSDDTVVVADSKEGWAKAYNRLLNALWDGDIPNIDYSKVRAAGERLKVFGGRASGPAPLKRLFDFTINTFKHAAGRKLNSLEVHDLMCMVGEIVVVGGVRRSALISLSNLSDQRMRDAKAGQWWQDNPQRALANNSVAYTEKPSAEIFMEEWLSLVKSKSGERGIFNREAAQKQAAKWGRRPADRSYGCNPCCVAGDTMVLTDSGHVQIRNLVGSEVNVWNGREFSRVTPFSVGTHPSLKVKLSNGVSIVCTHNHKFVLNVDGKEVRVEAQDLQVGDKLFKYAMPVIEGGIEYDVDAYSQGFYSGDGNTNLAHSWVYAPKYPCIPRLVGVFGEVHASVDRRMWKHGLMLPKTFVPLDGSLQYRLNWLAGLLDSDGSVTRDDNGNGFQISSTDEAFLVNVRTMLTTLGIQAKVVKMHDARVAYLPDGKGGRAAFNCQEVKRLLIGNMGVFHLGKLGLRTERLQWHTSEPQRCASRFVHVLGIYTAKEQEHFCFEEPINHTGTFNGVVTGQSEIILNDKQLCNLSEVIVRENDTPESLKRKVRLAAILGTFQATLTDFGFVSEKWSHQTADEALLGVSMTGIMDNPLTNGSLGHAGLAEVLNDLRDHARKANEEWAEKLGINPSAAITCVKPSGTVSQLCNTASGIHARHNRNYIRTVRVDKKDPLYAFMFQKGFHIEDDVMRPDSTAVVSFAMTAPDAAITRDQVSAMEALELWLLYQREWCEHKPSVTVTVKDEEWPEVGAWVYKHFDEVSGVSFLPHSDHTYQQAPYQDLSKQEFEAWIKAHPMPQVSWADLAEFEKTDNTVAMQTLACVAGACELPNT